MTRPDKFYELSRAVDKRHEASEKLIKLWEPILRRRQSIEAITESHIGLYDLKTMPDHIISIERQIIIIMTDFLCDSLKDTKDYHKVCLWSKN